jgi:hypothetical protein
MSKELLEAVAQGGGQIEEYDAACSYPLLIEDSRRLAKVCDEGYSADWTQEAAGRWDEDADRYGAQLEATPPAVLRRMATQRPLFETAAPSAPAPTFAQAEAELDAREFEIFGAPSEDVEIPF